TPPFAPFLSEFTILRGAIAEGRYGVAAAFLVLLFVVFVGMGGTVLAVVQGEPSEAAKQTPYRDSPGTVGPPLLLMSAVFVLGVYLPRFMDTALHQAAAFVEASP
ncbi:MAG TPA: hydrogenase, partial [Myxococcaceae bacterium]|nr:hydrogenase [Myxococcaceae bacterium]